MKRINKILCGIAACAAALAIGSCTTETVYVFPDAGVTRLTVYPLSVNMGYADDAELNVTIRPSSAKYEWVSEDESVAVVDENNHIVPTGVGTTVLTAKAGNKTFSVPVSVHSSIVGDSFFIENGRSGKMETVQVLPETVSFDVTNLSDNIISVTGDLTVTAKQPGVGRVTITTEDGISKTVSVGVTDGQTTMASGKEFIYDGSDLEHGEYGFSVVTFGTNGANYEGDAKWSGSGKGLAFKLYRDSSYDVAPDGTYTPGTSDFCFYTGDNTSYVVDAATGTKEYITAGYLTIEGNNVTANVIAGSNAYIFKYSGARPAEARKLLTEYIVNINDEFCNGTSQICIDTGGTIFYGGYTYMFQWRLTNSASNTYLMLFGWANLDPLFEGDYTFCGSWGGRNQCWTASGSYYSSYREGNSRYMLLNTGGFNVSNYTNTGSTVTANIKGNAYGSSGYVYTVAEIGIQNSASLIINIDVTPATKCTVSSRMSS